MEAAAAPKCVQLSSELQLEGCGQTSTDQVGASGEKNMNEACKTVNVLIVDDDLVFIKTVEQHLQRCDMSTTVAHTHAKALELREKREPDVIIANLDFDHSRGAEILRNLRDGGSIPIVVTGNHRSENDMLAWLEAGADEYLSKPLSMRELSMRINALVRRRLATSVQNQPKTESGRWLFGGWELRLRTRQLRHPSGRGQYRSQRENTLFWLPSSRRPISHCPESTFNGPPAFTRTSSIAASMFRFCACAERSKWMRVHHK
ncbi:hypothetical protein B5V01_00125 [Mesorhizobium erdmanii]|uniref:Response regulatory domain-containing protein n=2 Tax=Mesorhizobium TaxID=68287 RepID=A0A3M9X0N7_9HYPH|nr:hypothetical protein DNR46_33680 [Mesorhizobium japonicum]RXT53334.1 hypothetical protein B5V01_00125 [Mesorhizobium erdmanii]